MVEKISAVTLQVANMRASARFYKDVLGLEIIYGGEGSYFTSLRTKDGDTILNLEHGNAGIRWGRLIFHVSDVDRFWAYLMEKGFHPDSPQGSGANFKKVRRADPGALGERESLACQIGPKFKLCTRTLPGSPHTRGDGPNLANRLCQGTRN